METLKDDSFSFSLNKFAEGMIFSSITLFVCKIFSLVSKILLAKLGAEDFGLINLLNSLLNTLVILTALGMPLGVIRHASFYFSRQQNLKVKNVILTGLMILLPFSLLITLLGLRFALAIGLFFKQPRMVYYFKIIIIVLPFAAFVNIAKSFFSGLLKIKYIFLLDNLEKIFYLLFVVLFLSSGWGLRGAVFAYTLAGSLVFIVTACLLIRFLFSGKISFVFFKELFYFSWPVSLSEILRTLSNSADLLILGFFKGPLELGKYSALITLCSLIFIIPQFVLPFFLPIMTSLYAKKKDIGATYRLISWWLFVGLLPVSLLLIFQGQTITKLVFGKEYILTNWTLFFLVLANFIYSFLVWPGRQVLDMMKLTKINLQFTLARVIIFLSCWFLLVPSLGSMAIAFGFFFGWLTEAIWCLKVIYNKTGIFFGEKKYIFLVLAALLSTIVFLSFYFIKLGETARLIIQIAGYCLLYCFLYFKLFFSKTDAQFLKIILVNLKRQKQK